MPSSIHPENESSQSGRYGPPGSVSSDELLPPVEPPSAGFLIQLFVVPAVIVAAVVLLWFVIESLARRGEQDPDRIVKDLASNNQARFQRAKELADMLRLPERYPELKTNHELAQKLAAYLSELIAAGDDDDASVAMRYFLVSALGEFYIDDGLPVLLKAAREDPERDIRRKAVNAIAVLAGGMANQKPPRPLPGDELTQTLLELADDQDELIRSETAFALGVIAATPEADSQLVAKLEELADDPYTDARFNAAAGLARVGSPRAAAGIAEMLDPEAINSSVAGERAMNKQVTEASLRAQKAYKRNAIVTSALRSINQLLEDTSLSRETFKVLERALEKFIAAAPTWQEPAPVPDELLDAVKRTLKNVRTRTAP